MRVHRKPSDRTAGRGRNTRRYRCMSPTCKWEGVLTIKGARSKRFRFWMWVIIALTCLAIGGSAAVITEPDMWRWYTIAPGSY